ncbi:TetR/AcrR family transcriptional regulator [Paenisporosarcina cavernae]|nr:TetR/AcrR family transcriptional regulator [Paenisporosarcina cavernae]
MSKFTEEKEMKIAEVALQEFTTKGYKNTSTNVIAEKANVSKGLIFHYFHSKKKLFLLLLEDATDELVAHLKKQEQADEQADFFEEIRIFLGNKIRVALEKPDAYAFMMTSFLQPPIELQHEIHQLLAQKSSEIESFSDQALFRKLEKAPLREGLDREVVTTYIRLVLDSISNHVIQLYQNRVQELVESPEKVMDEVDTFLDMLQNGIYTK